MSLCLIRCTILDATCQSVAEILRDWEIPNPPHDTIGVLYDDYTISLEIAKMDQIMDDECKE